MKILFPVVLSYLLGNVFAAHGLRKEFKEDLPAKLETLSRGGEVSYDELDIQNDREAGAFCDAAMKNLLNQLPDYMSCSCRIFPFRRYVKFTCTTSYCLSDSFGSGSIDLSNVCIRPSYTGKLTSNGKLTSQVCNEAIKFTFVNSTGQNETVSIPKVCGTAEHAQKNFTYIKSCTFTVGNENCPCSVCASGRDVSLNCTSIKKLGSLAQYATFTCIGLSLFNGGSNSAQQATISDFEQNQPIAHFIDVAEQVQQQGNNRK